MSVQLNDRHVLPSQAFAWSLGWLGSYSLLLIYSMYALYCLVSVVKLPPALSAGLVFTSRMLDVIVSPLVEKTSAGLGVLMTGLLMSVAGFDNKLDPTAAQSSTATTALYVAVAILPTAGFAIGVVTTWRSHNLDLLRKMGTAISSLAPVPGQRAAGSA